MWAGECEAASPGYSDGFRHSARFNQPQGMCVHPRGQLLVADKGNHCIRQVTAEGALNYLLTTLHSNMPEGSFTQYDQQFGAPRLHNDTRSSLLPQHAYSSVKLSIHQIVSFKV